MSIVHFEDDSGNKMQLQEINGKFYPPFDAEVIRNVPHLKVKADDVMLSSYPKSGCHWLFEICRMLTQGTTDVSLIPKISSMIESFGAETLDKLASPRILSAHIFLDSFPKDVLIHKPKIVYVRRNPKDVVVSFYNHSINIFDTYKGDFSGFVEFFIAGTVEYGSWFDYVLHWEDVIENNNELTILSLTYEEMKEDSVREIRKISEFLELNRDDEFIEKVADACNFSTMKDRKGHLMGTVDGKSIMYRKGEVGDWKNWFTVAQNERFDKVLEEKMVKSKLNFKYCLEAK